MADSGVAAGGGTDEGEIEPFGNADGIAVRINDSGVDVAVVEIPPSVRWWRSAPSGTAAACSSPQDASRYQRPRWSRCKS